MIDDAIVVDDITIEVEEAGGIVLVKMQAHLLFFGALDDAHIDIEEAAQIATQASRLLTRLCIDDDDGLVQAATGTLAQEAFHQYHAPEGKTGGGTGGVDPQ